MNDELIQDLKQLIDVANSQSEQRMMSYMDKRFEEIDQRFEEIVDGTNQQTEAIVNHVDQAIAKSNTKLEDHEERIRRLERHTA